MLKKYKITLAKAKTGRYNAQRSTEQCAFSSAWLEHHLDMVGVGGSSPLRRTIYNQHNADFFLFIAVVSIETSPYLFLFPPQLNKIITTYQINLLIFISFS